MKIASVIAVPFVLTLFTSCGIDPAKIPAAALYADDGVVMEDSRLRLAIVGPTATTVGGVDDEAFGLLLGDVETVAAAERVDGVLLTGGYVARSSTRDWTGFAERWSPLLKNDVLVDGERLPVLPMAGSTERIGDKKLTGYGAAFAGVGADIGFGRVASWAHVDLELGEKGRWRFVFLDTFADRLGSRWDEQLFWLPGVVSGTDFDHLIVVMPEAAHTLSEGQKGSEGAAELLKIIDTHADVMKLKAVITGGAGSNEALLPTGPFGELHVNAGASAIPPHTLLRKRPVEGLSDELTLAPGLDGVLATQLPTFATKRGLSEAQVARLQGTEDEPAAIVGAGMPALSWWKLEVQGTNARFTLRSQGADGAFADRWAATWTTRDGWTGAVP